VQAKLLNIFSVDVLFFFGSFNFPPEKYPSFLEVRLNISLLLVNHHHSEGALRPTIPNLVDIGGLQTKEKPDPLPEKIQKWIDEAEHGVILFSFGSNVKSSALSEYKLKIILDTFAKVKQRVLFKWESDYLPVNLSNVMTSKWMPQYDILGKYGRAQSKLCVVK
jgi:glucuronosyltransferase